jgi:SPP1 gp7 family putative phage head morphogenesis protein
MPQLQLDPQPTPHAEAADIIRGKPALLRQIFDQLAPELRIRAFTISGVASVDLLTRIRDRIASIPAEHASWEDARADIAAWLTDWMDPQAARRRAELLLRTHLFQAYQAATWRAVQQDPGTLYLQYLATEDDRVRDTHRALNGLILPKTDPFWRDHYPPWEWGCRCRVRPVTDTEADLIRQRDKDKPPEDQLILDGPRLQRLRSGQLERGGRSYNIARPPGRPIEEFAWDPTDLRLGLRDVYNRMAPEARATLQSYLSSIRMGDRTLEDLLMAPQLPWRTARAPARQEAMVAEAIRAGLDPDRASHYREIASTLDVAPRIMLTRGQAYATSSNEIHIARSSTSWYGIRETIAHELGHAWLFQWARSHASAFDEITEAMKADLPHFQAWLDNHARGWRSWFKQKQWVNGIARALYGSPWTELTMPQQKRVMMYTDMMAALTGGRQGAGHKPAYWRSQRTSAPHEAIAHATTAYVTGDTLFAQLFPTITAWWRSRVGLP